MLNLPRVREQKWSCHISCSTSGDMRTHLRLNMHADKDGNCNVTGAIGSYAKVRAPARPCMCLQDGWESIGSYVIKKNLLHHFRLRDVVIWQAHDFSPSVCTRLQTRALVYKHEQSSKCFLHFVIPVFELLCVYLHKIVMFSFMHISSIKDLQCSTYSTQYYTILGFSKCIADFEH